MSLTLNMVGGGGGKLKDTDAILSVTAPTGSAITATKGAVTLMPTIWAKSDDNTLDVGIFIIHASQFDSNPWTVTATLDNNSRSATVVINSAKEYEIALSLVTYLIKDGLLLDSVQWDMYGNSTRAMSQRSGFVRVGLDDRSWGIGLFVTRIKYGLGGLSTLHLREYKGDGTHWGQSNVASVTVPAIGVSSAVPTIYSSNIEGLDAYQRVIISNNYIRDEYTTLDISNYNNQAYISLSIGSTGSFAGAYYVRDLWMD